MKNDTIRYHRPGTMEEFEALLAGGPEKIVFLAGGNFPAHALEDGATLIDLQTLGWDRVYRSGDDLVMGSLATLEQIRTAEPGLADLKEVLSIEAGLNVRNSLSLLNFLQSADDRSPFLTALLALAPEVVLVPAQKTIPLEKYLSQTQMGKLELISEMRCILPEAFAFESVARTPKDRPLICLAVARDRAGGLRVTCGGTAKAPQVLPETNQLESLTYLVRQAYQESGDQWASAEYRKEVAVVLLNRCLQKIVLSSIRKEAK
ncbi:MAG: FAD binding domain-containing protein [Anaerolineaceae bacterium]